MFVHGLPHARKSGKSKSLRFVSSGKASLKLQRMKEARDRIEKRIELEKVELENRQLKKQKIGSLET